VLTDSKYPTNQRILINHFAQRPCASLSSFLAVNESGALRARRNDSGHSDLVAGRYGAAIHRGESIPRDMVPSDGRAITFWQSFSGDNWRLRCPTRGASRSERRK
jgi:hypothetical protein